MKAATVFYKFTSDIDGNLHYRIITRIFDTAEVSQVTTLLHTASRYRLAAEMQTQDEHLHSCGLERRFKELRSEGTIHFYFEK